MNVTNISNNLGEHVQHPRRTYPTKVTNISIYPIYKNYICMREVKCCRIFPSLSALAKSNAHSRTKRELGALARSASAGGAR